MQDNMSVNWCFDQMLMTIIYYSNLAISLEGLLWCVIKVSQQIMIIISSLYFHDFQHIREKFER